MATRAADGLISESLSPGWRKQLADPARCISSPRFDALWFWGSPLLALAFVAAWMGLAELLPANHQPRATGFLGMIAALLTYGHLVAVAPRAYLNREVYASHRFKLTVVPVVLLVALIVSPVCFVIGAVLSVFWDAHHSAMQNFGLARIYDMKAGNSPETLRRTDLRLNWILYVGPLAAGASMPFHLKAFGQFDQIGWRELASLPGVLEGRLSGIAIGAIAITVAILAWSALDYARAIRAGYRMPAHKLAMTASSGGVSIVAWGFCSPPIALAAINIYHALQYFALVWLKEGKHVQPWLKCSARTALDLFLVFCAVAAVGYQLASGAGIQWLLAPFIACSLLHFWFDGFVWSVRRKQV